ncbi:PREDICTED: uncharacterized protein LOC105459637 [Wasmannia auropunctata]|uniref:uncharacterized protein LOC105459637 n=1 Tax=Wasmannia auropunctata TaxID=64793 RepID=UPI0005EE4E16|nr:PREDICTED: uncharacterized protein LOC105459637 [Wasmannia auropunctata]
MSEIRAMTTILRRMYSRKTARPLAGIRKKEKIMKSIDKDNTVDTFDAEDVSEFEADFLNVGTSHKMHEREMQINKERLKQQIVARKYFKEDKEPRFLTFAERELIHKLHTVNPEEWTVEKLSESFPALPGTIQKILRSKWSPRSVERVMEYDSVVKKNWETFRAGKLPLSPILSEHLTKFKDRKVILTDRELLAERFVPKLEFKKPKSQLFSSIVQTYLDEKQNDPKLLSQENNTSKAIDESGHSENRNLLTASAATDGLAAAKNTNKFPLNEEQSLALQSHADSRKFDKFTLNKEQSLALQSHADSRKLGKFTLNKEQSLALQSHADSRKLDKFTLNKEQSLALQSRTDSQKLDVPFNRREKPLTFDQFVKEKMKDINKESPEEGTALLNVYRTQVDASQEIQTAGDAAGSGDAVIYEEKDSRSKIARKSERDVTVSNRHKDRNFNIVEADEDLLSTGIKVRNKKTDTDLNYAKPIKIAKHLYKRGMTYRISDCYYDDDGEFLYRVPGVHS